MSRALGLVVTLVISAGVPAQAHAVTEAAPVAAGYRTGPCDALSRPLPGSGRLLRVGPGQRFPAIQQAVDAAREGDTVLVEAGRYDEAVTVSTPGLRIRGVSRSGVVLDGGLERATGFSITGDRVVLENMTIRRFTDGPVMWHDVTGYWGRHLTFHTNRLAGLVFESRCGQLDDVYSAGHGLTSFGVVACDPCDTTVQRLTSVESGFGAALIDVGRNIALQDSTLTGNHMGVVLATDDHEGPPAVGAVVRRNRVRDNNSTSAPGVLLPGHVVGTGILIGGGNRHTVQDNDVRDHDLIGIGVLGNLGIPEHPPLGNVVIGNQVSGSGIADLFQDITAGPGNCWQGNAHGSSQPLLLETAWSCALPTTPPGGAPGSPTVLVPEQSEAGEWSTWPAPREAAAWTDQPDDNRNGRYGDDGGVDAWLPDVPRVQHQPSTTRAATSGSPVRAAEQVVRRALPGLVGPG